MFEHLLAPLSSLCISLYWLLSGETECSVWAGVWAGTRCGCWCWVGVWGCGRGHRLCMPCLRARVRLPPPLRRPVSTSPSELAAEHRLSLLGSSCIPLYRLFSGENGCSVWASTSAGRGQAWAWMWAWCVGVVWPSAMSALFSSSNRAVAAWCPWMSLLELMVEHLLSLLGSPCIPLYRLFRGEKGASS